MFLPLPACHLWVPSRPTADVPGTSGADDIDFAITLHFRDGEDPFDRDASGSHLLVRANHSQAFQEIVSLIMGFSQVLNLLSLA